MTPHLPLTIRREIAALNRAYLHAVRECRRHGNPDLIGPFFGASDELAAWLETADPASVEALVNMPVTLFSLRLPTDSRRLLDALAEEPTDDLCRRHLMLRQLSDGNDGRR